MKHWATNKETNRLGFARYTFLCDALFPVLKLAKDNWFNYSDVKKLFKSNRALDAAVEGVYRQYKKYNGSYSYYLPHGWKWYDFSDRARRHLKALVGLGFLEEKIVKRVPVWDQWNRRYRTRKYYSYCVIEQ